MLGHSTTPDGGRSAAITATIWCRSNRSKVPAVTMNLARAPLPQKQYAALLCTFDETGRLSVMLLATEQAERWELPVSKPVEGVAPHLLAAQAAFDDAGAYGCIVEQPIGTYCYEQCSKQGHLIVYSVDVYPLVVEDLLAVATPNGRRGTWVTPGTAATLVREKGLRQILESIDLLIDQSERS